MKFIYAILLALAFTPVACTPVTAYEVGDSAQSDSYPDLYAVPVPVAWIPLRRADEQGDARAQGRLGVLYEGGQGLPQDYTQAVKWYRLSALQGDIPSQIALGTLYRIGVGVPKDYVEAVKWYSMAAAQTDPALNLPFDFALGDYNPKGHAKAQFLLGTMYEVGQGVFQNNLRAVTLYRQSAAQGEIIAQYTLGIMYDNGYGVAQDQVESVKWYSMAAAQGDLKSQNNLGQMYAAGKGVDIDNRQAVRLYRQAATQGSVQAQKNLGQMYIAGQGVPQNYILARMWFSIASANGYDKAIDWTLKWQKQTASLMSTADIIHAESLADICRSSGYTTCGDTPINPHNNYISKE